MCFLCICPFIHDGDKVSDGQAGTGQVRKEPRVPSSMNRIGKKREKGEGNG